MQKMKTNKTAHLLAKDYRFIATSPAFMKMTETYDKMDTHAWDEIRRQLAEINAHQLRLSDADPLQPTGKVTAPAAGDQPDVDMYTFFPKERQEKYPVIYFMHSSGYLTGNARQQNRLLFTLAESSQAVVVSVEYRKAGQAPYPADIHDAYHGLTYLYRHADEMKLDPERIILMGDSAGGGLAARLALKVRDNGLCRPLAQILVCPMLDYRTGSEASVHRNPYSGEFIWTGRANQLAWQMLRGHQDIPEAEMPYYSASMAKDLSGLPRTFIAVGSLDLFVNEDIDYANRLISAGVPTDLLVLSGVAHGIEVVNPGSPETARYLAMRKEIIRTVLEEAL